MNIIDIIFYVMEWKWGGHRYHILSRVGEQYRYHVLCNGKGVNIIDIIFYVMEMGKIIGGGVNGNGVNIYVIFYVMEKMNIIDIILCNGKGVNIIDEFYVIDIIFYVMEMG